MRQSAFSIEGRLANVAPRFHPESAWAFKKVSEGWRPNLRIPFHFGLMKHHLPIAAIAATILAASLAGCSTDKSGDCPTMTGVTDASVKTVFRAGATQDPANVLYTAEIASVTGGCDMDKKPPHPTDAQLTVVFRATRAASGGEARYALPYFVAVTEGARILARTDYTTTVTFEPGQTVASSTETVSAVHIDPAKDKQPYDYQILVALKLSRAELDYNRRTAHYQP